MSRYRGEERYSQGNIAYRDGPPNRWDADRLARERDYRDGGYYDDYYEPQQVPPPRRARPVAPVYEDQRYYYEDDLYGPRGSRVERRYFEEDDYYDPRTRQGQMVPFRPERPSRPPRPGQLLRRQSSLDTFDRPSRRYEDAPRRPPPRIDIDVPEPPNPRDNRYRPPQRQRREFYDEYDDIQVQDPEQYGDDGYREYREREWVRSRARDDSSRSRSRPRPEVVDDHKSVVSEHKTVIDDDRKSTTTVNDHKSESKSVSRTEIVIDTKSEKKEKPYPRRGKTKMPKRRVHTKVLFDLGYTFYEENEKTIVIEKALGPDNIEEIIDKSREYRQKEVSTTKLLEAPPAASTVRAPSPPPPAASVRESKTVISEAEVKTKPLSEAPRSVREWDNMTTKTSDTKRSHSRRRSVRSKSVRRSPSPDESVHETIIEKKAVVERSPSPVRTHRTSRSRARSRAKSSRRSSFDETEIIERRVIREEDDYGFDESASVHVGPLVIARDLNKPRSDRDIQREIDRLQAERHESRRERRHERDGEVIIERIRSRSSTPSFTRTRRSTIIERVRSRSPSPQLRQRKSIIIDRARSRSPSPFSRREELIVQRARSRSSSPLPFTRSRGSVRIERNGDELVEVRKERRDRSRSRPPSPPSSRLIKGMIYAAT